MENLAVYQKSLGLFSRFHFIFSKVSTSKKRFDCTLYCFFCSSQVKLGVLKFLASDLFEATDVLCHFIVATGDTRHRYVII